ncbi:ribosomal protein L13e-domain-containing protein [Mycena olivaceomarginata]|nr:ribosomal protein L13e-domain-containing protein [Mycena olivaceomarginata]
MTRTLPLVTPARSTDRDSFPPLRPAVCAQTVCYTRKDRGFTLAELKEAGIGHKEVWCVGIVVDHRRRNLSEEGKKINLERLLAYKSKLIIFPHKAGKPKEGDSTVRLPTLFEGLWRRRPRCTDHLRPPPPARQNPAEAPRKITAKEREFQAYCTLHTARANARHEGTRPRKTNKKKSILCAPYTSRKQLIETHIFETPELTRNRIACAGWNSPNSAGACTEFVAMRGGRDRDREK